MKQLKISWMIAAGLAVSLWCSNGLANSGRLSGISNHAETYLTNQLNSASSFVATVWSMLSNAYSLNPSFSPAGTFSLNTSFIPGVAFIRNSAFGTLEVGFGPSAPGPLENKGFALAPTRVSLNGNVFYVYQLPQCFTNITDSLTTTKAPQPCSPVTLFGNSNLGTNCVYASDPYAAAIAEVQGTGLCSSISPNSGSPGAGASS